MESVYLLIEREFIKTGEKIQKIGRSSRENDLRIKQYPKGSQLIVLCNVRNSVLMEKEILTKFKQTYKHRTDIGNEYFEGDCFEMRNLFFDIIKYCDKQLMDEFIKNGKDEIENIKTITTINYNSKVEITEIVTMKQQLTAEVSKITAQAKLKAIEEIKLAKQAKLKELEQKKLIKQAEDEEKTQAKLKALEEKIIKRAEHEQKKTSITNYNLIKQQHEQLFITLFNKGFIKTNNITKKSQKK